MKNKKTQMIWKEETALNIHSIWRIIPIQVECWANVISSLYRRTRMYTQAKTSIYLFRCGYTILYANIKTCKIWHNVVSIWITDCVLSRITFENSVRNQIGTSSYAENIALFMEFMCFFGYLICKRKSIKYIGKL